MANVIAVFSFLIGLLAVPSVVQAADQQISISRYQQFSIAWLLTADDPSRIKMGAQWIERDERLALEFADLAAKVLWEFSRGQHSLDADTVSWLVRALGATRSHRYRSLLEQVARENSGKIQNYASDSIGKLTISAESFDPDGVQPDDIRNMLIQERQNQSPNTESLVDVRAGAWIEEVLEQFGYPSDVTAVSRSRRTPFVGRIYVSNLLLVFGSKGMIEFERDRGDWYATSVTPRLTLSTGGVDGDDVVQGILSPNVAIFREVARRVSQMGAADSLMLEAAALRLRTDMKTNDDKLADGLAYLCVMIGNTGDVSYRDLLAEVGRDAARTRLRKHAVKALEKLSGPDVGSSARQQPVDMSAP